MNRPPTLLAEERIELASVGIDIGSATTHLLFSHLTLEKVGTRYVTTDRKVVYESPIRLTPYSGLLSIDDESLREFIDGQYALAGVQRSEIDTGALILTGVALLRENARRIGEIFALEAGRFVSVSAGDNLEAVMAAYGSGAVSLSSSQHVPLVNVDIGGGTTKLAICANGHVEQVLATNVGARVVVIDDDGTVLRLEPAGQKVAHELGINIAIGKVICDADLDRIAQYMVDEILAVMPLGSPIIQSPLLLRGEPFDRALTVEGVVFSGGVSEYIYGRQPQRFGDLGQRLAAGLQHSMERLAIQVLPGDSGIRATVIGASQYTAQVSGSTIFLSSPNLVPLRNVPVISPLLDLREEISEAAVAHAVESVIARFDLIDHAGPVALALRWRGIASFSRLNALVRGIEHGLAIRRHPDATVVLVFDDDIGRLIGKHLVDEVGSSRPVVSIDGVVLNDFDYIDVGELVPGSNVVPVVIKSLMFPDTTNSLPLLGH